MAGDETDPVKLPTDGVSDLYVWITSAPRTLTLDVPDLSEFNLGVGKLETDPIPVGDFISLQATLGAETPLTLTRPAISLLPVRGKISAGEAAAARDKDAVQSFMAHSAGAQAAMVGGVLGGIFGGLFNPHSDDRANAGAGGKFLGNAAENLVNFFGGDRHVRLTLDQGRIEANVGLRYAPFLTLAVSVTGVSWLVDVAATLQTQLMLDALAHIDLSGSSIDLQFHDGVLVRTVFTLTPSAGLGLRLAANGQLRLGATLLPIYKPGDGPGVDPGVLHGEIVSPVFELFDPFEAAMEGGFALTMAKGSPGEVLGKRLRGKPGGVRGAFVKGLKGSGGKFPFGFDRKDLDRRDRTGQTRGDAIPMTWFKPAEWYPDHLTMPADKQGNKRRMRKFPHTSYDGVWLGVDQWPFEGMPLRYIGGVERNASVEAYRKLLTDNGIELGEQLAYTADIDHVIDVAFSGEDAEENLWPLNASANRSAGVTQNRMQQVWWAPDKDKPPRLTKLEDVPPQRWFVIRDIVDPRGIKG